MAKQFKYFIDLDKITSKNKKKDFLNFLKFLFIIFII